MLRGTAEGWTGEDATVRAETYNAEDAYVVLAQSPVAADGSFNVSLPGAEGVANVLFTMTEKDLSCLTHHGAATGTFEMTPSSLEMTAVELTVYPSSLPNSNNQGHLGFFKLKNAEGSVELVQLYAAEDASLRGVARVQRGTKILKPGEGRVYGDCDNGLDLDRWLEQRHLHNKKVDGFFTTALSTGAIPEGSTWRHHPVSACELGDCKGGL